MTQKAASTELDPVILARCKAQDPIAFRAFVARYERPVFALLSRLLGRGPHVEDLAQESFLKAYRAFPGFDLAASARPSTWMLTIATRVALDAKKRPLASDETLEAATVSARRATPESESQRSEIGSAIARAAASLSDDQRAVFVLTEFHDLSLEEIAEATGAPVSTVKTRLFRARERLRELLAPFYEEDR
jgi:RNA polymerase sigma-70 factor (ECF subfamily)